MSNKLKLFLEKRIKELGEQGRLLSLQHKVLDCWRKNNEMNSLLEQSKEIILYPKTKHIYGNVSYAKEVFRIYYTPDLIFLLDYLKMFFNVDKELYVIYEQKSSHIMQGHPVLLIDKSNLQDWLKVLTFQDFSVLIFESKDGKRFFDVSYLDDEKDTPHYNITLRNEKIYKITDE